MEPTPGSLVGSIFGNILALVGGILIVAALERLFHDCCDNICCGAGRAASGRRDAWTMRATTSSRVVHRAARAD
jgi:hypothetical protein